MVKLKLLFVCKQVFEEADNSTLWGLFVNVGYLTINKTIDPYNDQYCITIPNDEVKKEFIRLTEYQPLSWN